MSAMFSVLPWLSQLLLMAALFALLLGRWVVQPLARNVLLVILLVLGFTVPLAGSTLAQWLRSVLGDLSVFTLVLLADIAARRWWNHTLLAPATRKTLLLGAAVIGVVFYPLALGVGPLDPYRLGFAPTLLVAALCLGSISAWLMRARGLAVILLLPLLAYNLHLLEADNLWNYLLDPVLVVYALVQIAWEGLWTKRQARQ
jgi:hypothetical protein